GVLIRVARQTNDQVTPDAGSLVPWKPAGPLVWADTADGGSAGGCIALPAPDSCLLGSGASSSSSAE
ncbi:hypothetical protein NDU88_004171, partial [Pleurodeles waltl]